MKCILNVEDNWITQEELNGCFGLPMTEIAEKLFPRQTGEGQQKMMDECCEVENAYLLRNGGILFPQLGGDTGDSSQGISVICGKQLPAGIY